MRRAQVRAPAPAMAAPCSLAITRSGPARPCGLASPDTQPLPPDALPSNALAARVCRRVCLSPCRRARRVMTKVKANEILDDAQRLAQALKEVARLKAKLRDVRSKR